MNNTLFEDSDEGDNDFQLSTNKDYAKSFNNLRKKELLRKFKDRGYDESESDSSTDSDSSEEENLDLNFDEKFFKTLASLKSKDPTIYDGNTRFFEYFDEEQKNDKGIVEKEEKAINKKEKRTKPVTLKDYERKVILERDGKFEDDSDTEVDNDKQRAVSPTLVEEERRLKAEFQRVINSQDSEEEEFGGIFKKRDKTKKEREDEEVDFTKWLTGQKEEIGENAKEQLQPLKSYWSNNKLPQSERFLRDYILNKGYADTNLADIPTYDEIVGDSVELSEDEQELEKQAEFEQKYNFRFEEPDSEFVQRYPRTIESTVRRFDSKRKDKRQEVKQRKQQEKELKIKELEMIKEMKRKEIEEKIRKLKMITGNEEIGFKDDELETDFDPAEHDKRMRDLFNDEYYQDAEGEEKPECPSDIEELKVENWDNYNATQNMGFEGYEASGTYCEDEDFNMDCDYDPSTSKEKLQNELIENTKGRRKRKGRRNRFMEMIQAEKPPFNADDEKTYAEYIDEYYKMDCEDIIDDIPCRFKYVETTPNDFGLTIEEILLAKNKELNQWASLKKATQTRPETVEKKEQRLYKLKAKNEELKRKIFKSLYTDESVATEERGENPQELNFENSSHNLKRTINQQSVETGMEVLNIVKTPTETGIEITNSESTVSQMDDKKPLNTQSSIKNKKKKKKNKGSANRIQMQKNQPEATSKSESSISENTVQKPQTNLFKQPFQHDSVDQSLSKSRPKFAASSVKGHGDKFKSKFSKRRDNKKGVNANVMDVSVPDERLKAYGFNPKKFHKKQKYRNTQN